MKPGLPPPTEKYQAVRYTCLLYLLSGRVFIVWTLPIEQLNSNFIDT
jgi:hypothetical protein